MIDLAVHAASRHLRGRAGALLPMAAGLVLAALYFYTASAATDGLLRVTVVERKPAAIVRIGSEHILADEEGVVLARLGGRDQTTLPLLLGVDGQLLVQGDQLMKRRIRSGIELAKSMAETLDGRIEIDVTHPVNVVASARGVRFHFGGDGLRDQWDRFMKVRAAFKMPAFDGRKHDGHDVDLRYESRVIVREGG